MSEPVRCVLCEADFAPDNVEHILPNAVGWSLGTRGIICPDCNARTGPLDASLLGAVRPLVTLIDPPGRRSKTPSFRPTGTDVPVVIGPGGSAQIPDRFEAVHPELGPLIYVTDETLPDFEHQLAKKGKSLKVVTGIDKVDVPNLSIDILDLRPRDLLPLAKAALHATAHLVPDWDREGQEADCLRAAILGKTPGIPSSGVFAWDLDQPAMCDWPFYHAVEVIACPQQKCLTARIHLFGLVRVRFLISRSYEGPAHARIQVLRDSKTGTQTELQTECPHPFPGLWARQTTSEFPLERAVAYFNEHRALVTLADLYEKGPARAVREPRGTTTPFE